MNTPDSPLEPSSIWSTSSTPQPPNSFSSSSSVVGDSSDIWASIPSTPSSSTPSGYQPTYLSTPPPLPTTNSTGGLDEFDPYSPSQLQLDSTTSSQHAQPPHAIKGSTLGSGVRKNSKLVLIDSDDDNSDNDDEGQRIKAEKEALELHEREKERLQKEKEAGGWSVGNMLKSLSSSSTSPSTSRPSTPNTSSPLTRVDSSSSTPPRPPPHQTNQSSSPAITKPFASIASVFRSTSSSNPTPSSTPPPSSSQRSTSLLSAIAGKGKQRELQEPSEFNEKVSSQPPSSSSSSSQPRSKRPPPTFDFNLFLSQMRSRPADPIAKYLRSFLKEFSRKPPVSSTDQQKIISDFLDFISSKMRQTDPWRTLYLEELERGRGLDGMSEKEVEMRDGPERAEEEFGLSLEAMEKLVMNRLWHFTFTPAIEGESGGAGGGGGMSMSGDLERDQVVRQRIRLFRDWLEPKHLDLPIDDETTVGEEMEDQKEEVEEEEFESEKEKEVKDKGVKVKDEKGKGKSSSSSSDSFIEFAASELRKMNNYKAPRDKLICVLNCCKVIFGLIRHVSSSLEDQGADTFIPFLIFVVLRANPEHLVSNLQYIQRFRNPEKLAGEGGYYLSSLNAAISFIETLDASSLSNITQSEFEQNVATAVKQLASEEPPPPPPPRSSSIQQDLDLARSSSPSTPTRSTPAWITPKSRTNSSSDETSSASLLPLTPSPLPTQTDNRNILLRSSDSVERAMSKPIGALARIFEQLEVTANEYTGVGGGSQHPSRQDHQRRHPVSPAQMHSPSSPDPNLYAPSGVSDEQVSREIERQSKREHEAKMGTLMELFGGVGACKGGEEGKAEGIEREVVEMVLWAEGGDVGKAVERLLEMSG